MNLPKLAIASLSLSAVLLVGGCRSGTNSIEVRDGITQGENIVLDGKLRKLAEVQGVNRFRQNGMLVAQVEVANLTGRDQNVATQWVWFEGNYQLPEDVRKTQNLEPRQTTVISGVAPNPNVDGFRLNINRAAGD